MTKAAKSRRELARHGRRGAWVKVFLERGHLLVRVQWREPGKLIDTQSWPNTAENRATALAYAEGVAERIRDAKPTRPTRLSYEALWALYVDANFPHLRPRTQTLYKEYFRQWALMWGWEFVAGDTTPEMADQFRKQMTRLEYAVNTMRGVLRVVRLVLNWAEERELIERNRLRAYRFKVAKEDRPIAPAEYRSDDHRKILAQLDPSKATQWRAFVALALCGLQGARQWAVLHLRVDDVTLGRHLDTPDGLTWIPGRVHWRAEWDKVGRDRQQPLRVAAQAAIEIALEWRERTAYTGPWLLPSGSTKNKNEVYSQQSLWAALTGAESRAGIAHERRRAAHGLRRMLAGDVAAVTGDFMLGLQAIGDTDPRMATRYIQAREDRVSAAFEQLDSLPVETPKPQPTRNADRNEKGAPVGRPSQVISSHEVVE